MRIVLCCLAVAVNAVNGIAEEATDSAATQTNSYTFSVHTSLPPYRFQLVRGTNVSDVVGIEVFRGTETKPLQVLTNEFTPMPWEKEVLFVVDANFDGYLDLATVYSAGATGNMSYYVWLYDPRTGTFCYNAELAELCRPKFEARDQRIYTFCKGGAAGMIYDSEVYAWEGSRLKLVYKETQDELRRPVRDFLERRLHVTVLKSDPAFVRTTRVLTNGVWKETKERVEEEEP
ncbi:MAG: hypothetical protein AB1705_25180 [Verrucomicrobiota bacterium]